MRIDQCKDDWALVTGASSGIGWEFCRQLGAAGMNLVMVARRRQRMEELAKDLETRHRIKTLIVTVDLSHLHAAAQVKAATEKENIRIRLLCNNAAFGLWGRFENTTPEVYEGIIQLVAATPIALCQHFRSDLESFNSSAIINLSSPAALQPIPYKAVYSAAKTCLHNFSLALYQEWKERGIHVQTLIPGPTKSELDEKGGAYQSALTKERRPPAEIVTASLSQLDRDKPMVTTARGTYKQRVFAGVFPEKTVVHYVAKMFYPPKDTG